MIVVFKQLQIFEAREYRRCALRENIKERRKVCMSLACVAGVIIL